MKHLPTILTFTEALEKLNKPIFPSNELFAKIALGDSWIYKEYDFNDLIDYEEEQEELIIINETSRIKKIITDIYKDQSVLLTIEPREFEEVIAELLFKQGFKVELTKQTRDNGYDIIALKYLDNHSPLKYLVECKRFKKQKVGVEIIRSFKEVMTTEKANKGIIVTTSYFSAGAIKKQKEIPYLLDFRDKDQVMEWVNNYWHQ